MGNAYLQHRLIYYALVSFVFIFVVCHDPYETLGVSRSAVLAEIKSAYHRKAMKWHPDKNPSEGAENKFTEITRAYQILSNAKKRNEYDTFGTVDSNADYYNDGNFRRHQFDSDMLRDVFGDYFQPFGNFKTEKNIIEVNFRSFRLNHRPSSRIVPLILLGYSHFCFMCQRIRPLWSRIADQLTPLGITVAVANIQEDNALREELRLLHSPGVLIVIDTKITYFLGTKIDEETIMDFITNALFESNPSRSAPLPGLLSYNLGTPLITEVRNYKELVEFHVGWREDSRPRAIFFKASKRPPLRICLAAFRAADYISTAFIDTRGPEARDLFRRLEIDPNQESLLILHEEAEPVYRYSSNFLSRAVVDSAMLQNSRLAVPRIVSPVRFQDLCPADGKPPSSAFASAAEVPTAEDSSRSYHRSHRHLCLVLLLHSSTTAYADSNELGPGSGVRWLHLFRTAITSIPHVLASGLEGLSDRLPAGFAPILSPVYLYVDRQAAWLANVLSHSTCYYNQPPKQHCARTDSLSSDGVLGHLIAVWRISSRLIAFQLLPRQQRLHPAEFLPTNKSISSPELADLADAYRLRLKIGLTDLVLKMPPMNEFMRRLEPSDIEGGTINPPEGWNLAYIPMLESLLLDELAAPLWLRIKRKVSQLFYKALAFIEEFVADPIGYLMSGSFILAVFFAVTLYQLTKDLILGDRPPSSIHGGIDPQGPRPSSTPSPRDKAASVQAHVKKPQGVVNLTPDTYDCLVRLAPAGQVSLILCSNSSPIGKRLSKQFSQIVCNLNDFHLVPVDLSLDRHSRWFAWALEAATKIPFRAQTEVENPERTTLTFNAANCVGTIIALNSHRRYFSMYHPLLPGSRPKFDVDTDSESSNDEISPLEVQPSRESVRYRNFNKILGLHDDEDIDLDSNSSSGSNSQNFHDNQQNLPLLERDLLSGLISWLDRLFEGSLRRFYVDEWPRNLTLAIDDH